MQKNFHLKIYFIVLQLFFFFSCQNTDKSSEPDIDLSGMDLRTRQYMVEGQRLYKLHCANCHMNNGKGLANLIPPLASSDYMLTDIDRTICLIKYGLSGEITVNEQIFNHPMPGNNTLTNLELAEISTYIFNSWGNKKGMINIDRVREALLDCE
jgi:cytochrome c551